MPEPDSRPLPPLAELRGEMGPRFFTRPVTLLLAVTGVLLLLRAARMLARWLLGRRVVATVHLGPEGLLLSQQTSWLGKPLAQRELLVPLHNLGSIERLTRFARFGFYAGLIALALGSYVGTQLMVAAVRGAPAALELLAWGPLVIAFGALLDFVLVTAFDSALGRCRLRVVTKDGRRIEVGALDPPLLDALLSSLQRRLLPQQMADSALPDAPTAR